jgi:DNA-binding MarR family transcriptional regulator
MNRENAPVPAGPERSDPPEVGLGLLLRDANNAFNRLLRDKLAVHGVTFSQFQHLRHLWNEDGLNQVELSRRIGIEKASSTSVIDSLEQRGLISRSRDSADRRKLNVHLTPAGGALEKDLWACATEANAMARRDISREEMQTVFKVLRRIIDNASGAAAAKQ